MSVTLRNQLLLALFALIVVFLIPFAPYGDLWRVTLQAAVVLLAMVILRNIGNGRG